MDGVFQGRYELLTKLGEGGFATVYKARQIATGQFVAIKVLRLSGENPAPHHERRIARFQREMQICAQIHHPNIVRIIDSGEADDGVVYSIFEFVPGKNLAEVLTDEGRLNPVEARYFMMQALDALACAHREGVVHRDFKPANIMITPTGARRNALVLDFGIGALTREADSQASPQLTATHESVGTPSYSAPEQLCGHVPTPRSDLYSWGLVFIECLTGKRVVEGSTMPEVVYRQISPEPVAIPSWIADHPLGAILRRVTAKDPEARDVSAEAILRRLDVCDVSDLKIPSEPEPLDIAGQVGPTLTVVSGNARRRGPASRLVEGERRQITAVCCRLTVTSLRHRATEADLEELDQVLGVHEEVCSTIARRLDGHVAGVLGDSVLFYFGYPVAREDDARRAARAALAMVAEIEKRNGALESQRKVRVDLRVGVHTGFVVAREARDQGPGGVGYVVGTTPKIASQLAGLAEPGAVVVSGGTERLIRKQLVLEAAGVRSLDDATPVLELFTLRPGDPASSLRDLPLVGRERELDTLFERWTRARSGAGQALLLSGEAGIGKSRLARALGERLGNEPTTWLECRCAPDGTNSAFHPIIDLIDRMIDPRSEAERPDGAASKSDRLEALLSLYEFDLAAAMPLFAPLLSIPLPKKWTPLEVSPQKQRELTRNAVLSLLFEMAEKEALVFVVEDLHWADPSTLELLGQLVSEVGAARVLALMTARPEFAPAWSSTPFQLQLGRLDRVEIERMVTKVTAGRALPADVLEQVVARTDGVPLFVEELVVMMIETGSLVERDGRYVAPKPIAGPSVPATLRDSLTGRLDRLARVKETAQIAAAIGREFSYELLRSVSALDEAALDQDLDRLVAADLVYRKRRLKASTYLFKHALIRDAAYASMLERSRQQIHARVARALKESFPDLVTERPELVAHHLAAADQKGDAIEYALKAAMGALLRSANVEAVAFAREAIGWLDAIEEQDARARAELALHAALRPALLSVAGWVAPEILESIDRSQKLVDSLGDGPHAVPTLFSLLTYHHTRGSRALARATGERLVAIASRAGDPDVEVTVLPGYGQCLGPDGKLRESAAACERALALYNPAKHRGLAFTHGFDMKSWAEMTLGYVRWIAGRPVEAGAHVDASVKWAREVSHPPTTSLALCYVCMIAQQRGERQRVIDVAGEIVEMDKRFGLPAQAAYAGVLRSWATRDVDTLRGTLGFMDKLGFGLGLSCYRSLTAELLAERGDHDGALAELASIIDWSHATGELYWLAENLRATAAYRFARDERDSAEVEALFRRALGVAREQGAGLHELRTAVSYARVLAKLGRRDEARAVLDPVVVAFPDDPTWAELAAAKSLRDDLARA